MTAPPPVPPEAIDAAAEAIHQRCHDGRPCTASPMPWHVRDARAALEAAAPAIRAPLEATITRIRDAALRGSTAALDVRREIIRILEEAGIT